MSNEEILKEVYKIESHPGKYFGASYTDILKAMDEARTDAKSKLLVENLLLNMEVDFYKKYAEGFRKLSNDYHNEWKKFQYHSLSG